jgi:16S rRNA (cytidine1402-2'-O)-methyltransferase
LDAHTENQSASYWTEKLLKGTRVALVSDAGTPAVSDPGSALVAQASVSGVRVTPIPGPSAVMALLSASGYPQTAFTFRGFFPRKKEEQIQEIKKFQTLSKDISPIWIWFESPQRIEESLLTISSEYPELPMTAGKELTKVFEKIFYGSAQEVAAQVGDEMKAEGKVGEWCFSVCFQAQGNEMESGKPPSTDLEYDENTPWVLAVKCLLEAGVTPSESARVVSQQFGIPRKICYQQVILYSQCKKTLKGG